MVNLKSFLCVSLLSLAVIAPAMAQTYGPQDEGRRFNDGTRVKCHRVEIQRNRTDSSRVGGTVAGALVGGLLGNQIGKGKGKKLATVGGAVAGGATGRYVQGRHQEKTGNRRVETRCDRE